MTTVQIIVAVIIVLVLVGETGRGQELLEGALSRVYDRVDH